MNPPPDQTQPAGLLGSLREFGASLLDLAQSRVELVALELQETKLRLIQFVFWISAILVGSVLTLGTVSLTVVYLSPEPRRAAVLVALSFFYLAGTLLLAWRFRRYLRAQAPPLAGTLEELRKDRACIPGEN